MQFTQLSQRVKRSLTVLGALACAALATTTASAQTGLGIRTGQPEGLTFGVDGRLTFEAAAYAPLHRSEFAYDPTGQGSRSDVLRMPAGTSVTQARIAFVSGYKNWKGRLDVNFAGQRVTFCDIILNYSFNEKTSLTLGYELDPFSMGVNTASRHASINTPIALDFLARGERHWGITATHSVPHFWISGGLYAGTIARTEQPNHRGEGYGVSLRTVYRPLNTEEQTLHIGASWTTRAPEQKQTSTGLVHVGVHPGSSIDGRDFISASINGVYRYDLLGGEIAYRNDRLFLQGEYAYAAYHADRDKIPQSEGLPLSQDFRKVTEYHGGYLTGSVMLRGKQRRYLSGAATFANVHNTIAPGGNIEVMGRLGYLEGRTAGSALEALGAINWYPNQLMMLGLSYTYTGMDAAANADGALVAIGPNAAQGLKLNTVQLRAQFVF